MRQQRAGWPAAIAGVFLGLLLALAPVASARKLQMSGTWALRMGQIFIPFQFARPIHYASHTSMGDLSKAYGFPWGPLSGMGAVTATGSAPAGLRIPAHRFAHPPTFLAAPLTGQTLVQLTTRIGAYGPVASATLAPGSGPGSFTWCPSDPACTDPPAPDPPPGQGGSNGRIVYRAGANRFGGTIQLGLAGSGLLSLDYHRPSPTQYAHHRFDLGSTPVAVAVGGSWGTTARVQLTPSAVTQVSFALSSPGLILFPGPLVTTMEGLTTTCPPGCGALLVPPAISSTHRGFPATTGTVLAQQTTGTAGPDFFTVMGSDMRSALGAGNISVVAGGLARRNRPNGTATSYAHFQKIWLSLAPPVPSLSPVGAAVAGALVLLAVGYALRRRVGR